MYRFLALAALPSCLAYLLSCWLLFPSPQFHLRTTGRSFSRLPFSTKDAVNLIMVLRFRCVGILHNMSSPNSPPPHFSAADIAHTPIPHWQNVFSTHPPAPPLACDCLSSSTNQPLTPRTLSSFLSPQPPLFYSATGPREHYAEAAPGEHRVVVDVVTLRHGSGGRCGGPYPAPQHDSHPAVGDVVPRDPGSIPPRREPGPRRRLDSRYR